MLDSDATLLCSLDELFFLPPTPVAMPLAYWAKKPTLASHIMLITPSTGEFARIAKGVKRARRGEYDMDVINKLYRTVCVLLDHKRYALLTGEFRANDHSKYLSRSASNETWDPMTVLKDARLVHFSDYPLPKPWLNPNRKDLERVQPACIESDGQEPDCTARAIWLEIYRDYKERKTVGKCLRPKHWSVS